MRYREGLGRRGAVWIVGTAGVYGGLYGFSAADRTFVVLGVVVVALAVVGGSAAAVLGSSWWSRRRPEWVEGAAEVRVASPPPEAGTYGTCHLALVVVAPGLRELEVEVSPRLPVGSWPEAGDSVPVRVDVRNMRRVRVRWEQLRKAANTQSDPDDDLDLASPPPWQPGPGPGSLVAADYSDDDLEFGFADPAGFRPDTGYRGHAGYESDAGYEPDAGYVADPAFSDGTGYAPDETYFLAPRVLPLEEEPSNHTARYLFPTERFRGEWRRHWVRPMIRYTVTLGLAIGAQFLVPRFVPAAHAHGTRIGIAVAGGLVALHVLFAWQLGRLVLTNRRVMLVEGVVRRRVSMVPLPRAADLRLEQSVAGRLFNYGDFVFERKSFFSRMRVVAALPNPNELYLRTVEETYEPGAVEARLSDSPDAGYED